MRPVLPLSVSGHEELDESLLQHLHFAPKNVPIEQDRVEFELGVLVVAPVQGFA